MVRHRPPGPRSRPHLTGLVIAVVLAALASCTSEADDPEDRPTGSAPAGEGDVDRVPGVVVQPDAAALRPDGNRIVVPCLDDLCVWDTVDRLLETTYPGGDVVAWSPDGNLIATSGFDEGTATVELLDTETGQPVRTMAGHDVEAAQDAVGSGISDLLFDADGTTLASAGDDGTVRLWSVRDGALMAELGTQSSTPDALSFDPTGSRLAVAAPDAPVEIWDLSSADLITTLDAEPQGDVAWSPDGSLLASSSNATGANATVRLWDGESLEETGRYEGPVLADRLAFSPDGSTLAVSLKQDPEILLWSIAGGDLRRLTGRDEPMRAVLWAPDGNQLYAVAARTGVLAWDLDTDELLDPFELPEA